MSKLCVKFHNVTFVYGSACEPLFENICLHAGPGWSGVVGANGTGKTTLLKLAAGLLQPVQGHIERPTSTLYCPQRTDDIPEKLSELIVADAGSAHVIKSRLGIQDDWLERWVTLSHGERKRAQIGVALCLEPDVLAVDEPTNHLDGEARRIVTDALHSFEGVGLVVSHDRELLDLLCRQSLFMEPPDVIARPGGVTTAMETAEAERRSIERRYAAKKHASRRVQKEAARRTELAKQSQKRRSKRLLARKDHDGREKKDRARVSGKDAVAGKVRRQMEGRLRQAQMPCRNNDIRINISPIFMNFSF